MSLRAHALLLLNLLFYILDGIEPHNPVAIELVTRIVNSSKMAFYGVYNHDGTPYDCKSDKEIQKCATKIQDSLVEFATRYVVFFTSK
mgnify:FL=1